MQNEQLIQDIARTFVDLLRKELSVADWREMQRRNATAEYRDTGCCASHDFLDANVVMAEACEQYGVNVTPSDDDDDGTAIWNAAWEAAMPQLTAAQENDNA